MVIDEGSGGYVCGEETALITTLEGRFGEPRPRPPSRRSRVCGAVHGGKQSGNPGHGSSHCRPGGKWFSSIGSKGNAGTKVISVNGSVSRPCLVEVPLGTTSRILSQSAAA